MLPSIFWIAGAALASILFDGAIRGRFRPHFMTGTCVIACALGMLVWFGNFPYASAKSSNIVVLALFIVVCIGSLLIDKNNIEDQENNRMSMWGSWWDGWDDNYFSNVFNKWKTWLFIGVFSYLLVVTALGKETTAGAANGSANKMIAARSINAHAKAHHSKHAVHRHQVRHQQ